MNVCFMPNAAVDAGAGEQEPHTMQSLLSLQEPEILGVNCERNPCSSNSVINCIKYFLMVTNTLRIIRMAISLQSTMVVEKAVGFQFVLEEWCSLNKELGEEMIFQVGLTT